MIKCEQNYKKSDIDIDEYDIVIKFVIRIHHSGEKCKKSGIQ